jgi:hypothetical protein
MRMCRRIVQINYTGLWAKPTSVPKLSDSWRQVRADMEDIAVNSGFQQAGDCKDHWGREEGCRDP